ncbi:hypothetical protein K502DRAFT_325429 [Neoconidiobolus thromboides FSU 785]|nr:hypothetical protein K502DRAFT_325429 [Neoconidiobolus thromboides FSU 785]
MTSWDEVMTWEKVYIYADADCSGDVWYLNKPAGDVVDEANDVMSSVRIVSLSDASNELKNVVENLPNHDISMIKVIPGNSTVKAGKVDSKVSL